MRLNQNKEGQVVGDAARAVAGHGAQIRPFDLGSESEERMLERRGMT